MQGSAVTRMWGYETHDADEKTHHCPDSICRGHNMLLYGLLSLLASTSVLWILGPATHDEAIEQSPGHADGQHIPRPPFLSRICYVGLSSGLP